jgi:hypothetical protein
LFEGKEGGGDGVSCCSYLSVFGCVVLINVGLFEVGGVEEMGCNDGLGWNTRSAILQQC